MGAVRTKIFKSGNSAAVRLPKEMGFAVGTAVTLECDGDVVRLVRVKDAVEEKRRVAALVERLLALPGPGEIEKRVPIEFPDRPGLY